MTGLIGFSSGYHAMMNADTLVLLGTQFPTARSTPPTPTSFRSTSTPAASARCPVNMALVGDIHTTLTALLPQLEPKRDRAFLDKALEHYRNARRISTGWRAPPTTTSRSTRSIWRSSSSQYASDDAIFTCDVGATVWAARYVKMNGKRRLLGSFNHGSMANAMPQAIGAEPPHRINRSPCAATAASPC